MATLLGYDDIFLRHRTGKHPERPARLTSIIETVKRDTIWSELLLLEDTIDPDPWILTIHTPDYLERLEDACRNQLPFIDTPDSAICPDSFQVAKYAVGLTLAACNAIASGTAQNGFCSLRPPGHHAEKDLSMGFCLFNNIAIAARYLQQQHRYKRILILDWDAHHGNGTQHAFERDDTVFYASFHQHPATLFPGTGWPQETGEGPGRGYTLNLPLEPGAGDDDCLEMFQQNFLPVAREFNPDFILVSAGYDAHRKDPLSQLEFTEKAFDDLTRGTLELASRCCDGRLLSLLEGGYQLGVLSTCVLNHLKIMRE